MRQKIVAGNWKMFKTWQEGRDFTKELVGMANMVAHPDVKMIICPPFIHLNICVALTENSVVSVGAQNCAVEEEGAYTGEVSAKMLKSVGVEYVILGHSERRTYYGETNEILNKKIRIALKNELKPIYCVGETLQERNDNIHFDVVKNQLVDVLTGLSPEQMNNVVIAYEPVWAIGTGLNATPEQAQEMHAFIRNVVSEISGASVAENISILYGGSLKPENAASIYVNPDVDGGLVGGASLQVVPFMSVANAFPCKGCGGKH